MNERLEIREKLRDELIQMFTIWDTTMVCTTLLLGCTFEFISQGTVNMPASLEDFNYLL